MRNLVMGLILAAALFCSSCAYYNHIANDGDHLYVTGQSGFIFYTSWIQKCVKDETSNPPRLLCSKMQIVNENKSGEKVNYVDLNEKNSAKKATATKSKRRPIDDEDDEE